LVVMDLHGLRVDVRLERVEAIRQGRKLMGHSTSSLKIQNIDSTAGASLIDARQHAVEGDLGPVFLVFGDDDAVVHLTINEPFQDPEQMVRRHTEHRRAEAADGIERKHGLAGLHHLCEPIYQMQLRADRPGRPRCAFSDLADDVLRGTAVVGRLYDIPWYLGMHNHAYARMLFANPLDLGGREALVNRAMPFPEDHPGPLKSFGGKSA